MSRLRTLVLPLFLLLLTATAHAATYWVSPSGASGSSGADSLGNAKTLAWFNANAVAGDICRFKSGTYVDPILPTHDGTSGSRIRYYGFPQSPGAVTVADIRFGYQHGSYCTVRWVSCTNGATGLYEAGATEATDDSIVACQITGQTGNFGVCSKRSVLDSLVITGTMTSTGQSHFINLAGERDHANGTIGEWSIGSLNNRFTNSTMNVTVNTSGGTGDVHVMLISTAAFNTISGNTFNVTVANCSGYFFGVEQYEGYSNQLLHNTWNITLNGPIAGSHGVWCHRDSSSYNRYVDNTVNVVGSGAGLSFMLSNPGSFPGTTGNNCYSNNVIRDDAPQSGTGVFWFYDGTRRDTVQFNTISTNSGQPCVSIGSNFEVNGTVFRHNTYYTTGATAFDCASTTASNGARCVSQIYYCRTANASASENARVSSGFGMDSSGVYFTPGSSASHALYVGGADGAPGSGGSFGIAGEALWGSPQFSDSSYATFNPHLSGSGYAVGSNLPDAYAGAVPFGGGSSDVTPPGTVSDLAVTLPGPSTLSVSWTAPGNDGLVGTATTYDLRWSSSVITPANFATATPVTIEPIPAIAGTHQLWVGSGLSSGTTYYYAIRTRDAAGNWSGVSNSGGGTTTAVDTTPPASIKDLTAGP